MFLLAEVIDNALVLRNVKNLLLLVNGEAVETKLDVADDQWHHVAVVWSGRTGRYESYKDGVPMVESSSFQKDKVIYIFRNMMECMGMNTLSFKTLRVL